MREREQAFIDELVKQSFRITPATGAVLTSSGLGALWRGNKGYEEARAQGQSRGQAARAALRGGAIGAAGGAALGGAVLGARKIPGVVGKRADEATKALYEAGGQQMHALTGKGTAAQFGGGSSMTLRSLNRAKEHRTRMRELAKASPSWWRNKRKAWAEGGVGSADKGHKAMQRAEEMGLTSLPGTIGALQRHRLGDVARTAWDAQIGGMGTGTKALMFGLPAAFGVAGAVGAKPGERGQAIGESVGLAASNIAPAAMSPSLMTAFHPAAHLMPTYLMSRPFMWGGKQIGRGADWAVRKLRGGDQ